MSVYDFTVKDNKGNDVSLSEYKGKVLLIVSPAFCLTRRVYRNSSHHLQRRGISSSWRVK